jgi:peroxiredoxin Q/BCP
MNHQRFLPPFLAAAACFGLLGVTSARAELKPGDQAPEFKLKGSDGKTYQLSDYKDRQPVVLAWYPKAFTGG